MTTDTDEPGPKAICSREGSRYDWWVVLTFRVRWRTIHREMRYWNPRAPWWRVLWWTLTFPHVHH